MDEFLSQSSLELPNLDQALIDVATLDRLQGNEQPTHKPRILLLYGSTRERSFSRLLTQEAARILTLIGAETVVFDPSGLPLPDDAPENHPKVKELRDLVPWSEGQVWCSPERHGAMSAVFKAQIDWIPLAMGAVRPSQGKTLAVSSSLNGLLQAQV
ncbi:arsenical resistance protein arsH [Pseudomonas sp. M47T1]|nr:arsenical resistance protein arsH [Pseudomonas sp. M47T1]